MIEQSMAPTISEEIGANNDLIKAARLSLRELRIGFADLN